MINASVLVFGDFAQTLAVVRSLSGAGYRVIVGSDAARTVAGSSRYCAATWHHGPLSGPGFAQELAEFVRNQTDLCCLYPIGISHIERVQQACAQQGLQIPIAAVSPAILEGCNTKTIANQWAQDAGIAVPASHQVHNHAELLAAVQDIGFPVIVKTVESEALVFERKAFIVADEAAFNRHFTHWPIAHGQLLVQAYIEGEMVACDFVAQNGEVVAYYEGKHNRTDMPDGTGFVIEFVPESPTEKLFLTLKSFVSAHTYSGPGLLQCMICKHTGEHYFVEINPRLSAGVAETWIVGVDIPLVTLQVALQKDLPRLHMHQQVRYRLDTMTYWFERDWLGWLKQRKYLTHQESRAWLLQMMHCLISADAHINWHWRDPMPSGRILGRFVKRALSRALGRDVRETAPQNG